MPLMPTSHRPMTQRGWLVAPTRGVLPRPARVHDDAWVLFVACCRHRKQMIMPAMFYYLWCLGPVQVLYHGPHPESLVRSVNFLEFVTPKQNSETVVPILRANCLEPPFSIFDLGSF